jgi:hypothetical protein
MNDCCVQNGVDVHVTVMMRNANVHLTVQNVKKMHYIKIVSRLNFARMRNVLDQLSVSSVSIHVRIVGLTSAISIYRVEDVVNVIVVSVEGNYVQIHLVKVL